MTPWVAVTLKVTVLAVLGFAALAACRQRSAATRHLVVGATLLAIAAVAPIGLLLPAWDVSRDRPVAVSPFAHGRAVGYPAGAVAPTEATTAGATATGWLVSGWPERVWLAGAAVSMLALAAALLRLRRCSRRTAPLDSGVLTEHARALAATYGIGRAIALRVTESDTPPATWGLLRPRVILPAAATRWSPARARAVLAHECAHIRRHDWATQLAAEVLRAVFWFHPLIWVLVARLRRESELACDDTVIGLGVAPDDYATHLIDIARTCRRPLPAALMAHCSTLEQRITAMLVPTLDRTRPSSAILAATCALWMLVTLPLAAFRTAQSVPMPLSGAVYDATGAVLPEVQLSLRSEVGVVVETTTDATGRYEFPAIAPGRYALHAALKGFRPLEYALVLQRDRDWMQIITLQVGSVRESISVQASRLPPGAPSGAAVQSTPIRVGGNIRPPTKTRDVRPVYPDSMRAAGIEGIVPLEATISAAGTVQHVRVLSAGVHPDLARAAVDAVRQWEFEPTRLNGIAVDVLMTTVVQFTFAD